jgi:hypothetical protein
VSSTTESPRAMSGTNDFDLDFVRCVAARAGVVRCIDSDNGSVEVSWSDRRVGQPFAVYLAKNGRYYTLALDFDASKADAGTADRESRLAKALLFAAGLRPVLVESGPTGGRHVIARLDAPGLSGVEANRLVRGLAGLGFRTLDPSPMLNPKTGAIRPPKSPHRLGGHSKVMGDETRALADLQAGSPAERARVLIRMLPWGPRTRPLRLVGHAGHQARLLSAPNRGHYKSRSEEFQALATRAVNDGQTLAEFRSHVTSLPVESAFQSMLDERGSDADRFVAASFANAMRFVRDSPARRGSRNDDAVVLADWAVAVATARLRPSVHKTAEFLLRIATENDRALVGGSSRDVAVGIARSKSTAAEALAWMQTANMIEIAGEWDSQTSRRYRLKPSSDWSGISHRDIPADPLRPDAARAAVALAMDAGNDIYRVRGGLSEACRRVYLSLASRQSVTAAQIAGELGTTAGTVRRHLARLGAVGLARAVGAGHWAAEVRDPHDLARQLGTDGYSVREKRRHESERVSWRVRGVIRRLSAAHTKEQPVRALAA